MPALSRPRGISKDVRRLPTDVIRQITSRLGVKNLRSMKNFNKQTPLRGGSRDFTEVYKDEMAARMQGLIRGRLDRKKLKRTAWRGGVHELAGYMNSGTDVLNFKNKATVISLPPLNARLIYRGPDRNRRLVRFETPRVKPTVKVFFDNGRLVRIQKDAGNQIWTEHYNGPAEKPRKFLLEVTTPDNSKIRRIEYEGPHEAERKVMEQESNGTKRYYDNQGRVTKIVNAEGQTVYSEFARERRTRAPKRPSKRPPYRHKSWLPSPVPE